MTAIILGIVMMTLVNVVLIGHVITDYIEEIKRTFEDFE